MNQNVQQSRTPSVAATCCQVVIPVAFQSPEVNRGHSKGGVVQKAADLLHRLTGLPPKLGG